MSKFTPGPWSVDNSRHEGSINRMEPFRHIGMVSNFLHDHSSREENEANAKLIAAAPEMLDALLNAKEWLSGWASAEPYLSEIEAVIAKATQ